MLELKKIKKTYKVNKLNQIILDNINICFRDNEFVSILGPSGAGKTTLLNIIGGLDRCDDGDILINGKSTKTFKNKKWDYYRNKYIGFIFQNYNLIEHMSVLDNVMLPLKLSGYNRKKSKNKALKVLKKVELEKHFNKRPSQLSGGQKQRVAIARALVNDPKIILADEPTGALDSNTSTKIMKIIKEIAKDKLVIMVTHNRKIAEEYSNRIVCLKDGKITKDTNVFKNKIVNSESFKFRKTSMKFTTAVKLSFNNIISKKGRTFLTSIALSIGIIGIALILSISNGFDKQLKDYEKNSVASLPISINNKESLSSENKDNIVYKEDNSNKNTIYVYQDDEAKNVHVNNIDNNYVNYLKKLDKNLINVISCYYLTNFNLLSNDNNNVKEIDKNIINFDAIPNNFKSDNSYLKENYDLLAGRFPSRENEVVLIVDDKNRADKSLLEALSVNCYKNSINYSQILGKELKIVYNDDFYDKISDNLFVKKEINMSLYNNLNNETIKFVGVLRPKMNSELVVSTNIISSIIGDNRVSKIGYTDLLIKKIVSKNKNSLVVKAQQSSENIVTMGNISFKQYGTTKNEILSMLGANSIPFMINIYPKNFNSKEKIKEYLDKYNNRTEDKIIYSDLTNKITSLSSNIINGITVVLIAFSSISLLVSSVMISIITYISTLERTKEIGILRSLGARKKDISRVFNSESIIIGFFSGIIGILITRALLIIINVILNDLTAIKNLAVLNPIHAIILIIISVLLASVGGFIPSKIASKKDPVKALREG